MNAIRHILRLAVAVLAMSFPSCTTTTQRPQPRVFLWTHGHFRNNSKSGPFHDETRGPDLFMALSYCGQDDGDSSLPPLDVVSNVKLRVAGQLTDFAIDTDYDTNREHICVTIPVQELKWIGKEPFKIEWRVGSMKSNTLIANLLEDSVESTMLYPKTPRPLDLRSVETITYADYNWRERTPDLIMDKQRLISFFFNRDGPKPWRFSYWHLAYVYGVKGTNVTVETRRSLCGDVSNEEVLALWTSLRDLGIEMPSWRDGPNTETGQKWEWFFYADRNGKRVSTERDEEYYKLARTLEEPLKIEFEHESARVKSSCEYAVKRDSAMWQAITDIFLDYTNAKQADASFQCEVTALKTEGDDQPCVATTLEELLAHPEKYHGRRVRVAGYHHAEFEHSSLSAGPASIRKYKASVWLGGMSHFANPEDVVSYNDAFISVEGTFTAGQGGHLGLWAGEIGRLTKIEKQNTEQDKSRVSGKPRR